MDTIRKSADKVMWLDEGQLVTQGEPKMVFEQYLKDGGKRSNLPQGLSSASAFLQHGILGNPPGAGRLDQLHLISISLAQAGCHEPPICACRAGDGDRTRDNLRGR